MKRKIQLTELFCSVGE